MSSVSSFFRRLMNFILFHHPFKDFLEVGSVVAFLQLVRASRHHEVTLGDDAYAVGNELDPEHIVG